MKRILITGKDSYIGQSLIKWLERDPEGYYLEELDLRDNSWKDKDFSSFDVVFHVAGIAHNSSDPELEDLYYQVNRDLTVETANKTKQDGVQQFVFMSSMIVYGTENEFIDENTEPNPDNFYGDSKLQAEVGLQNLKSDDFKVVILRPPMIYGKGSKGNYPLLAKLAKKTPIFSKYENKRSMLHIDNLCEFVRLMVINEEDGIFHPQNKEYVQTSEMVRLIAEHYNHKIWFTKIGNPLIRMLFSVNVIKKVFGNLYYDSALSDYRGNTYQKFSLKETIFLTERE